jgi:hypothetical protein
VSKRIDSHRRSHRRRGTSLLHPSDSILMVDKAGGAHESKGLTSMTKSGTIVSRFGVTEHCDWLHVTFFVPSVLSFRLSSRLVASESTFESQVVRQTAAAAVMSAVRLQRRSVLSSSCRRSCLVNLLIDLDLEPLLPSSSLLPSARERRPPDGSRSRAKQ